MNSFANPEEATPFVYPEFPKAAQESFEAFNDPAVSPGFADFFASQTQPTEEAATLVQPALFQDFKDVLAATQG
ncbi:MAG TPA: hypothetical protein VMU88_03525 [bacterium]|nr:hypothetical protein [bacterium]